MITFFTTCKNFTGTFGIIQQNALRCWFALGVPTEVIVFGQSEGLDTLKQELPIVHVPNIRTFEGRIPYISSMFNKANEIAKYDIVCFLNADILVTPLFVEKIVSIHQKLKRNYLIVGQRINFDLKELLSFGEGWQERLSQFTSNGEIHDANGSDLFVFPKGQFAEGTMPDLLVGRPGWDLWMLFNSRQKKYKTIDLSTEYLIFHQNHDYSHKIKNETKRQEEDQYNYEFIPEKARYIFQLSTCDHEMKNGELVAKNQYKHLSTTLYHNELLFGRLNWKYFYYRLLVLFS